MTDIQEMYDKSKEICDKAFADFIYCDGCILNDCCIMEFTQRTIDNISKLDKKLKEIEK